MEKAVLCALLLLWPPGGASQRLKGDLCRIWTPEFKPPVGVFGCPSKQDPPNAEFCCGTCTMPYCCSSEKNRLDQHQCHFELLNYTPTPVPVEHWRSLWFFIGFATLAVSYACASLLYTHLGNRLIVFCWNRLTRLCERRHEEVELQEMGSGLRCSAVDTPPSSTCVSLDTTSLSVEHPEGSAVVSPPWGNTPIQVYCASYGLPEDEAISLSSAALLNTGVSSSALEATLEMEDLSVPSQ